jgi:hypothetical protein
MAEWAQKKAEKREKEAKGFAARKKVYSSVDPKVSHGSRRGKRTTRRDGENLNGHIGMVRETHRW